ncbi:tetraacyldisaccharide 4'-kinase [Solidesulfovibrio carbinolicus]|uniref:Tetraacyldisaccharide 4'-kinase n=1 Tax=Solidesulfovibrio carbinolicus TaxID=296842 RepID=A0A4P6HPN8_9BACT|nr:tetraacyldisaccharide 4'-kinase [Solidesulfovibrio carbinolicus]QAZ69267.1 tetraacyldisaccharide 4'-kinase [Solidesulfovibrio carbinolicus]
MANARRTRRRRIEPSRRPLASSPSLTPKDLLRRLLAGLLVVPGQAVAGYRRLEARAFGLGLGKVCRPAAATVAVGGMSPDCRGRVMLTSWLLGWAAARGVSTAVAGPVGDGCPPASPFQVLPGSSLDEAGIEAALLARYSPDGRFLIDADPRIAAAAAVRAFAPSMLVLQDALGEPRLRRDLELAILTPDDLGPGFGRVFPAGSWRRGADALSRAAAFIIHAGPQSLDAAMAAAERRLAGYGKPIFGMTFSLWRWRGPDGPAPAPAGQPYVAILGETDRDSLPDLIRADLGAQPRMAFFVHDRHRFTRQDFEHLRADAVRLRTAVAVTSPRFDLKLRQGGSQLSGLSVWTYDPEVVFGPRLLTDQPFLAWWETRLAEVLTERLGA